MITTAQIQNLTRPQLAQVFASLGHTVTLRRPPTRLPGATDEYGNAAVSQPDPVEVRGYLYPLDAEQRARFGSAGAQTSIPDYVLLLPFDTPVSTPGFVVEWGGQTYMPKQDAEDLGGQGVAWRIYLGAPGAR